MKVTKFFSKAANVMSALFLAVIGTALLLYPFTRNWKFNTTFVGVLVFLVIASALLKMIFCEKLSSLQWLALILAALWLGSFM